MIYEPRLTLPRSRFLRYLEQFKKNPIPLLIGRLPRTQRTNVSKLLLKQRRLPTPREPGTTRLFKERTKNRWPVSIGLFKQTGTLGNFRKLVKKAPIDSLAPPPNIKFTEFLRARLINSMMECRKQVLRKKGLDTKTSFRVGSMLPRATPNTPPHTVTIEDIRRPTK